MKIAYRLKQKVVNSKTVILFVASLDLWFGALNTVNIKLLKQFFQEKVVLERILLA